MEGDITIPPNKSHYTIDEPLASIEEEPTILFEKIIINGLVPMVVLNDEPDIVLKLATLNLKKFLQKAEYDISTTQKKPIDKSL